MLKKIVISILIVSGIILILWMGNANKKRMNEKVYTVSTTQVEVTDKIENSIKTSGKVKVYNKSIVNESLPYDAIIQEFCFEDGDKVTEGQLLMRLKRYSDEDYEEKLKSLDNELQDINDAIELNNYKVVDNYSSRMSLIKKQLENVDENRKTQVKLLKDKKNQFKDNKIDKKELDQAQVDYDQSILNLDLEKQNLIDSKTTLEKAKLEYDNNEKKFKETKKQLQQKKNLLVEEQDILIYSPKAGYAYYTQNYFVGSYITRNTSMIQIIDLDNPNTFYIEAELSETDYKSISNDSEVLINTTNELEENVLKGKIKDERPVIIEKNNNSYYMCKIDLTEKKSDFTTKLFINMPVEIKIESSKYIQEDSSNKPKEYYILPIYSVVLRDGKNAVLIYEKDKKDEKYHSKLVYVDVVVSDNKTVVIKNNKFSSDALIITEGNYNLYGGERIALENSINEGNLELNLFD